MAKRGKIINQRLCASWFGESAPQGQGGSGFASWDVTRFQGWGEKKYTICEDTRPKWLTKNDKNALAETKSTEPAVAVTARPFNNVVLAKR